ncbi:MAG: tRNA (adenosine(37)-N6)-threonylcarbamoyltransferase complex ATPase subunit type 1 TsaE [Chlamydiia bacterium]|nr:tRNA (adenosine(37)-N6)-threonylcarbamoyltransferase complex ATPase subunit type 1 TsaE [Chlamydiia bacterium]
MNLPILSDSIEATIRLGSIVAHCMRHRGVIALSGDLGAGKTHFVKGVINAVTGLSHEEVVSPTFGLVLTYGSQSLVHHFDLYRLKTLDGFREMGFDELVNGDDLSCIEWPECISEDLPADAVHIKLTHLGQSSRQIIIESPNPSLITSIFNCYEAKSA